MSETFPALYNSPLCNGDMKPGNYISQTPLPEEFHLDPDKERQPARHVQGIGQGEHYFFLATTCRNMDISKW